MQGITVTCFIASVPHQEGPVHEALRRELDLSCQLPGHEGSTPRFVIGTLDLNQGRAIPAREHMSLVHFTT